MTHEHEQPAAGHLAFATGGVVSGAEMPVPEPVPASFAMPHALGTAPAAGVRAAAPTAGAGQPTTHAMPSGYTVTVAPLEMLTRRDRTDLMALNRDLSLAEDPERGKKIMDAILARLIVAWTYPWPLPSADPESLERLPMTDVWDVEKLTARADKLLFVGPVTPDDHADPTSPTAPSGE
jgi:hypothetical protein